MTAFMVIAVTLIGSMTRPTRRLRCSEQVKDNLAKDGDGAASHEGP